VIPYDNMCNPVVNEFYFYCTLYGIETVPLTDQTA